MSSKIQAPGDPWGGFFLTFGVCQVIIFVMAKELAIWDQHLFPFKIHWSVGMFIGILICLAGLYKFQTLKRRIKFDALALVCTVGFLFVTDWLNRDYSLLHGPIIRGEIILFTFIAYLILSKNKIVHVHYFLIPVCVALFWTFISRGNGQLIFSDDHTVFFYRLSLLKENFPNIPFYNPYWNAGQDARDFFATGSLNFFFIFAPIIYALPLEYIYNFLVATLLFVITPGATYYAAKRLSLDRPVPAVAAILSMTSSLLWYRWALQYGTMGFLTSLALIPLNIVIFSQLLSHDPKLRKYDVILFPISFTLMLFWTLSGLVFFPALAVCLFRLPKIIRSPKLLISGVFILLLNLPWLVTFWSVSKVSNFIAHGQTEVPIPDPEGTQGEAAISEKADAPTTSTIVTNHLARALKILRENAISANPLILVFGLFGLFLLPKDKRRLYAITALWLLFVGGLLAPMKPRLELDRFLLILCFCLSIPTALCAIESVKRLAIYSIPRTMLGALTIGILFTGAFSSMAVILNRSPIQYSFSDHTVDEISKVIAELPDEGRILFSGFVLHELSGGHLAPLAYFTGKPLVAASPVHNQWSYRQLIPATFLEEGDPGIERYFDLMNASAVFAHEQHWRDYFNTHPDVYKKIWQGGKFQLFARSTFPNSYFVEGTGKIISQDTHSITLSLESKDAVIKFNYFPFLTSSACQISNREISESLDFIELKDCPLNTPISIYSVPVWERVFGGKS